LKEGRPFFGEFYHDSGTEWFRAMHLKGYRFKDYRKGFAHMYWATAAGHVVERDYNLYKSAEENAKYFYESHMN
jgi:hypothetical protein